MRSFVVETKRRTQLVSITAQVADKVATDGSKTKVYIKMGCT